MGMNHSEPEEQKNMDKHEHTHHRMRFAMGFAFGALVGTLICVYATQNMERGFASEKLSRLEDAIEDMKAHTQSMGNAVGYTFRTVKKAVGKGSDKIMREAEAGIKDIKKNF